MALSVTCFGESLSPRVKNSGVVYNSLVNIKLINDKSWDSVPTHCSQSMARDITALTRENIPDCFYISFSNSSLQVFTGDWFLCR